MPQPVDMQTELARVSATERIQQIADRASLAAQQRQAIQSEEEREVVETQVQDTQDTHDTEVQADGRRRNPFVGRRKKKKDGEAPHQTYKNPPAGEDEGQRLDVTI